MQNIWKVNLCLLYLCINKNKQFMSQEKLYTVQTKRITGRGSDRDSINIVTGTLEELTKYFSYTLEVGASWNKKVNRWPKSFKGFMNSLQLAYEEKEAACYNRTYVSMLPTTEKEIAMRWWKNLDMATKSTIMSTEEADIIAFYNECHSKPKKIKVSKEAEQNATKFLETV